MMRFTRTPIRYVARAVLSVVVSLAMLVVPFGPLGGLMVQPARADLGQCLSIVTDVAKTYGDAAADIEGLAECVSNAATGAGAALEVAIAAVLTAIAIADKGFPGSGANNVDRCNDMIDTVIGKAVTGALVDLYHANQDVKNALDSLFGAGTMQGLIDDVSDDATAAIDELLNAPPFVIIMSYIQCGCTLVGGVMDAAKDVKKIGGDAEACVTIIADVIGDVANAVASGVEAVGEALGDLGHDIGCFFSNCDNPPKTWDQCVALYTAMYASGGFGMKSSGDPQAEAAAACKQMGFEHTGTSAVPDVEGLPLCTAGWHTDFPSSKTPPNGGPPYEVMLPACSCPHDDTEMINSGFQSKCVCNNPAAGYNGKEDSSGSSCSVCPAGTENTNWAVADNGTCRQWGCPSAGTGIPEGAKGTPGTAYGECTYASACDAGSVESGGSCQVCSANQYAAYGFATKINIASGIVESAPGPNDIPTTGRCVDCPFGWTSPAGSTACTPLQCSLEQQLTSDGHACGVCQNKVGKYLDAQVCEDASGTPIWSPQACDWGTAMPIKARGGGSGLSPVAYNPADCKPLNCKGTDHPDDDGHACEACKAVINLPLSMFGGGSTSGTSVSSASDGKKTITLPGGKSLSIGDIQSKGATKSATLTDSTGKTQVVSIGAKVTKEQTVAICMDPDNNPADRKPVKPPRPSGGGILEQQPNLHPTLNELRPGTATPMGGDPGNYPIAPGFGTEQQGVGASIPMDVIQGRPGPRRPPGGGTGSSLPAQGGPAGGQSSTIPGQGSGGTATPLPAQGEPTGRKPGEGGGISTALPAEGDGKAGAIGVGPARTPKGSEPGGYTTETMPAEGNRPLSAGPERSSKDKGNSGYTTETMPAEGNAPVSAGPARSSKGKASGGFTTTTMPAEGDGNSPKSGPQLHTTPKMNEGPQLRTTPSLNGTQQLRMTPQLNTPQGGQAPSLPGNTAGRTKPTLNDSSSSGPTLNPGGRSPSSNPFGR